jgi:hypothetical protein
MQLSRLQLVQAFEDDCDFLFDLPQRQTEIEASSAVHIDEQSLPVSKQIHERGAINLEPAEPHQRPTRMKNAIYNVWNTVADGFDAAIEFYDWWIDKPGPTNRFAKPDVILPLAKKADLQ